MSRRERWKTELEGRRRGREGGGGGGGGKREGERVGKG